MIINTGIKLTEQIIAIKFKVGEFSMDEQVNVYRHEMKYYINKRQAVELGLFLKRNMTLDPNSDETGSYWIRSLYFDTINNNDYYEKIIGHNIRKKIRLRIYNISTNTVKLEIKNKYNNYIHKESVTISREDAIRLTKRDYNFLPSCNNTTANKVYAYMHKYLYHPTVIIDYEREAYFYPFQNIRITIDKNLRAAFNNNLFNDNKCSIQLFNNSIFVLEIKYNHMIPFYLQKVLSNFEIQKSQISKYCLGRILIGR